MKKNVGVSTHGRYRSKWFRVLGRSGSYSKPQVTNNE